MRIKFRGVLNCCSLQEFEQPIMNLLVSSPIAFLPSINSLTFHKPMDISWPKK